MTTWADQYIKQLDAQMVVKFRPRGHSMTGLINDGQMVTVTPWRQLGTLIEEGHIVLCRVKGRPYLHKVIAKRVAGGQTLYQIGNNKGGINGWTPLTKIYGVVTQVEP